MLTTNTEEQIVGMVGKSAIEAIKKASKTVRLQDAVGYFKVNSIELVVPVELDKGRFSNG